MRLSCNSYCSSNIVFWQGVPEVPWLWFEKFFNGSWIFMLSFSHFVLHSQFVCVCISRHAHMCAKCHRDPNISVVLNMFRKHLDLADYSDGYKIFSWLLLQDQEVARLKAEMDVCRSERDRLAVMCQQQEA